MKVRVFDKFDHNFTCVVYDDVEWYDNDTIYFKGGDKVKIDTEFTDIEIIA